MKNKWKTILLATPLLIATPLLLTTTISCNEKVEQPQPHIQGTEEQTQPQETEPFAYVEISNIYTNTTSNSWLSEYKFEVYTREVFSQEWKILETFYLPAFNKANEDNIRNELFNIFERHFHINLKDFITLRNIWKNIKFHYNNNENPYKN